ncbi:AAA family ATPase [Methylosinus sp. H3A]|uniref:ATP-dependent nuclease n=1 Tax=Methylosinus sp. H3A TaxID=2785786 RepID=UPI0018C20A3C|nr:AAA family ATPase [Methylosinus sp. H3A]MBG0812344.1 AAA family ATPase [Methylosinus sp. H3A]
MANRSKLLKLVVRNLGCIGPEGIEVALDNVVCLVGKNNAGKSTILRAYELAIKPSLFVGSRDRCRWTPGDEPSVVELDVHIPEGVANVDEKWKSKVGDYLVVRSRWEWAPDGSPLRKTWDPVAGLWSNNEKAGGADNVFKSRLPRPLRIGSLQDASETQAVLLALALSPFAKDLSELQKDPTSDLAQSVSKLANIVSNLSKAHEARFTKIAEQIKDGFAGVFPGLGIRLDVAMAEPKYDLEKLLKEGSGIRVTDGDVETSVEQQGAGARRALFWSMLTVHNQLSRFNETETALEKALKIAKSEEAKAAALEKLEAFRKGEKEPDKDDPAFPGYLLLIDEPENALHPMAARAAQRHLYQLAEDPEWQVMMTTHSPYFVNPLEDHTTIVRLERAGGDTSPLGSKTYRADDVAFDPDTKRNLKAVQQMDVGFSEVFFGSHPILVEGDTEHAAFIAAIVSENHELAGRATVIRARGKAILPGLITMLRHFRVPFSIVHDVDWPFNHEGGRNGMWTMNQSIYDQIVACRNTGIAVRHRCSIPDFERSLGGAELGKDKPISAYLRVVEDPALREKLQQFLVDICDGVEHEPFGALPPDLDYLEKMHAVLRAWNNINGKPDDIRLIGNIMPLTMSA